MFSRHSTSVDAAYQAAGNGAILLDVRTSKERKESAPKGSTHVPMDALARSVGRLDGEQVYVICRSGRRSAQAAKFLRAQGIDATNVKGGMLAWHRHGLPTEDPRKAKKR